jgi:hypothetical protein
MDATMHDRDDVLTGYPGSKGASGVWQKIIRQMPPHTRYVEAFAGYAKVYRSKRPASTNILMDIDPAVCQALRAWQVAHGDDRGEVWRVDALEVLSKSPAMQDPQTLVYADPPYLASTRTRLFYDWEFDSIEQHTSLLRLLLEARCMCMVSGYWSQLYSTILQSWRVISFPAMTRGGLRQEYLWCNFPEPTLLHDPRYAGENFRERERIGRKRERWHRRFAAMPAGERQVIAEGLAAADPDAIAAAAKLLNPKSL